MTVTGSEEKLRELILLRGQRKRFLSTADEQEILETAITTLDLPAARAKGIILATADSASIETESELTRVVEAMILALAGSSKTLSYSDFMLVVKYYSRAMETTPDTAAAKIKEIMNGIRIQPARAGFLPSLRWFRAIK